VRCNGTHTKQSLNEQLAASKHWVGLRESWDSPEFSKETAGRVSIVKDAKGKK